MLTTNKDVLEKADKGRYAVGAFNINNMESLQAIVQGAGELESPVIIQTTEGAIDYAGILYLSCMVRNIAKKARIPITLHLDHGKSMEYIKLAMENGYTSVMIDGSALNFEKNVRITRKVVRLARKKRISVEAELGTLGGQEDYVKGKVAYTDPDAAVKFAEMTGCDTLAIAIGTSHGAYKFKEKAKLDMNRLKEIKQRLGMPLVLHGASGIPHKIVKQAEKYGAKLGKAKGVPDPQIRQAVKLGINKVNIDSDLRLAFDAGIRKVLKEKPEVFDPRKILGPARDLMTEIVKHKIRLFGSIGKARVK
ncbi:class II fructose-1,6-bisphosphate aldolase [Candidatus Woesearchaeota archaeon]|nr:class II fructose-1,6-bisphosphate aldolase [Candidatus Woesearchaeota archaeon]